MATPSIINLLKKDHKEVSTLFEEALATTERAANKRAQLFAQINDALTIHTRFEEEHLYPVLAEKRATKDDALEAVEEHGQIKHLLQDISATDVADERWKAKLMVLSEDVHHHVKEEEKSGGFFDDLKKALSEENLTTLAEQYQAEKAASV